MDLCKGSHIFIDLCRKSADARVESDQGESSGVRYLPMHVVVKSEMRLLDICLFVLCLFWSLERPDRRGFKYTYSCHLLCSIFLS